MLKITIDADGKVRVQGAGTVRLLGGAGGLSVNISLPLNLEVIPPEGIKVAVLHNDPYLAGLFEEFTADQPPTEASTPPLPAERNPFAPPEPSEPVRPVPMDERLRLIGGGMLTNPTLPGAEGPWGPLAQK